MAFQNMYRAHSILNVWVFIVVLAYIVLTVVLFRYYLTTSWKNALGITIGNMIVNILITYERVRQSPSTSDPVLLFILAILCSLITALLLRIFFRWATNTLTSEERTPGLVGLEEWLGWPNVALSVAIALCVAILAIRSGNTFAAFLVSFFICICAFSLYPAFNTILHFNKPSDTEEDIRQARLKILDLLESGRITPAESVELLKAVKGQQTNIDVEPIQRNIT